MEVSTGIFGLSGGGLTPQTPPLRYATVDNQKQSAILPCTSHLLYFLHMFSFSMKREPSNQVKLNHLDFPTKLYGKLSAAVNMV